MLRERDQKSRPPFGPGLAEYSKHMAVTTAAFRAIDDNMRAARGITKTGCDRSTYMGRYMLPL